jgi:uncharacterized membrane protein YczE
MKEKRTFYCEMAYVFGIIVLAIGTAFMERADFGMSMVVAPAYLLHLKISQFIPFFSFGMSTYLFQGVLLVILSLIMGKFKKSYFLSFATAFIYGLVLDGVIAVFGLFSFEGLISQIILYVSGMVICSCGVALLFHTYFPPEAYELVVKELSQKTGASIGKIKTIYDCCSCILGIVLCLCFFGSFVGVKLGTIICAIINGWLIGRISKLLDSIFVFKDALPLRSKLN